MKRQIRIIACILCLVMILQFAPAIYAAEDTETAEHMIPIESNIVGKQNVLILERDGRYYLSVEDISQLTRSQLQIQENKLFLDHGIRQIVIDKKACKAEDHILRIARDQNIERELPVEVITHEDGYYLEAVPMLMYMGATCTIVNDGALTVWMPPYTIYESIREGYWNWKIDIEDLYGGQENIDDAIACAVWSDFFDFVNGEGIQTSFDIHIENAMYEILDVDVLEYNSAQTAAAKLTEELNNFLAVCGEEHTSASTFLMELYLNLQETQISHGTLLCQLNGILKNTDEVDRISKELNQKLYEHLETKRTVEEIGTFMDACTLALDIAVTSDTLMRYDDSTRKLFANTVNDQILSAAHYNIMFKNITDKIAKNLKSNGKIIESTTVDKIKSYFGDAVVEKGFSGVIGWFTSANNLYAAAVEIGGTIASLFNYERNEAFSADLNAIILGKYQEDLAYLLKYYYHYACGDGVSLNEETFDDFRNLLILYYRTTIAFNENYADSVEYFDKKKGKERADAIRGHADQFAEYLYRITNCKMVPLADRADLEQDLIKPEWIEKVSAASTGMLTRVDRYDESGALVHYRTYSYHNSGALKETVIQDLDQGECISELQTTFTYNDSNKLLSKITENPEYPGEGSGVKHTYDDQGRMISSLAWEGGGVEIIYEYDEQNRVVRTREAYEGGTSETTHTYDDSGRLIKDVTIFSEEWNDETWTDTTVYRYDDVGRLSSVDKDGAYESYTGTYDYTYLPIVIIDRCYNGNHSFYAELPNGSSEMESVAVFDDPQFYTDEDGCLAKVVDHSDFWGTCTYVFHYDSKIANPVNGPFRMNYDEPQQSTTQSSANKMDLIGNWYSETANKAYIFTSTGNNWSVTGSGIQSVSGEYVEIDLHDRDTEFGGFDFGTDSTITFYRPKSDTKSISLNADTLSLDGHVYRKAPSTITNQVLGRWNCGNLFVQFDGKKCTENTDGELRSEGYYVLSDSLFVVWRNGSYRVREYSIDGTTMIYQYNTYHKDGADSSASTLESLASAVVGTWRDDSYYEYYIYANGTYQRYFNLYSSRGELELHNLEEQGTYEILDHEKIRLWVNGERVMYDDFIYNPQDDTLYMKYSDRTFVRCS